MKHSVLAALALWFAATLTFAQGEIRVDDDHMQIGDKAGAKLSYTVPAGPELLLDIADYKFSLWPADDPAPDAIWIVISDQHPYDVALAAGQTRIRISKETAKPRPTVPPFPGFAKGAKVLVSIGKNRFDPVKQEHVHRTHWLAMVEVR